MKMGFVGDSGIDVYVHQKTSHLGGCSLNLAIHSKELWKNSADICVFGALGTDEAGQQIQELCRARGIISCHDMVPGPTARCPIELSAEGDRKFVNYEAGVLRDFQLSSTRLDSLASFDWIHGTYYPSLFKVAHNLIQRGKKPSRLFSMDFSDLGEFDSDSKHIETFLPYLDLVILGLKSQADPLFKFAQARAKISSARFLVTLGATGVVLLVKDQSIFVPAKKVPKVVDTTGAGDAFLASYLYETLLHQQSAEASLEISAERAAKVVEHLGAFLI